MADEGLIALVVDVPAPSSDLVSALLFEAGAGGVEEREVDDRVELRAYGTAREVAAITAAMAEALDDDEQEGLRGEVRIRTEKVGSDWRRAWADGLTPVQVTPSLTVVPDDDATAPTTHTLVLERALAFGFGEHPTTRLAARAVERACRKRPAASVLDVGTGGGLLALVAERAGASAIVGIDIDAASVEVARRNARRNGAHLSRFEHVRLENVGGTFDVVVANIDVATLLELASGMARRLAPGGTVFVTGILLEDRARVVAAYEAAGLALHGIADEDDWLLLELRGA